MSVHYSSLTDQWPTPQALFDELDGEFHFTLDPCADASNAKCAKFYTKDDDGLAQDWDGETVFCNPPYGRQIGRWVEKLSTSRGVMVALLPSRTDTKWFHDHIQGKAEIRFIKGRLKFGQATNSAPFPSLIAIWRNT